MNLEPMDDEESVLADLRNEFNVAHARIEELGADRLLLQVSRDGEDWYTVYVAHRLVLN